MPQSTRTTSKKAWTMNEKPSLKWTSTVPTELPWGDDRRSFVLNHRQQAQEWLDAHPEEPPKTFWQYLADGFASLGEGFVMMWGDYRRPDPTQEEIYARVQETMNRAWCQATVQTLDEVIRKEGWNGYELH